MISASDKLNLDIKNKFKNGKVINKREKSVRVSGHHKKDKKSTDEH